jgi:uncharacterized circularly permuted ATP-grasp superfamily protein
MDNLSPEAQSAQHKMAALQNYQLDHAFDEMFAGEDKLREHYSPLLEHFAALPQDEVQRRKQAADLSFLNQGITFTVYGNTFAARWSACRCRAMSTSRSAERT